MCGIAGIFQVDGNPASADIVRKMGRALAHRGPDEGAVIAEGACALAHQRLAILDETGGRQPMVTEDGRYTLNYNGEVFNFEQLRSQLIDRGFSFRSHGDTEVVLKSLACWGPEAVTRFNGMFALALWDRKKQSLFLARDRYGIKPLYYTMPTSRTFLFASEVKAFMQHPAFRVGLNPEVLMEYLTFQNVLTENTLFKGVSLLPPGSVATMVRESTRPVIEKYWDFEFRTSEEFASEPEASEHLHHLFEQAVQRQLVSDVGVSSYLSGGIDSASVTAVARKHVDKLRTFTVGFDTSAASGLEAGWDERAEAEQISYLLDTQQYEMVLKAGDMERAMPQVIWHLEDLRLGQSYPNFYASELASAFGKVVLSGAGGDELFGGYPWRYYRLPKAQSFDRFVAGYYTYWQRLLDDATLEDLLAPVASETKGVDPREIMRSVFPDRMKTPIRNASQSINLSLYFEARTFLHGLLIVEDRLSMAHGLETRVPFLDNDLVDFAMLIPPSMKLARLDDVFRVDENVARKREVFLGSSNDGKQILRNVLSSYLPKDISHRQKQGFSAPDSNWFRGDSTEYVQRLLLSPNAEINHFLNPAAIHRLVTDHLEGRVNRRLLLWALLSLENWCRLFLRGDTAA